MRPDRIAVVSRTRCACLASIARAHRQNLHRARCWRSIAGGFDVHAVKRDTRLVRAGIEEHLRATSHRPHRRIVCQISVVVDVDVQQIIIHGLRCRLLGTCQRSPQPFKERWLLVRQARRPALRRLPRNTTYPPRPAIVGCAKLAAACCPLSIIGTASAGTPAVRGHSEYPLAGGACVASMRRIPRRVCGELGTPYSYSYSGGTLLSTRGRPPIPAAARDTCRRVRHQRGRRVHRELVHVRREFVSQLSISS